MAAADNPYFIQPPNVYQALMSGVGGYDKAQAIATQNDMKQARIDAANALQTGGDIKTPLAKLLQVGDVQGANAIANYAHQQATIGLTGQQIAETGRHNAASEALTGSAQAQTEAHQTEAERLAREQEARVASEPKAVSPGQDLVVPRGPNVGKVLYKSSGNLSDTAMEIAARQDINGDQTWKTNIGRGAQATDAVQKVMNRKAEILTSEYGKTPQEAAEIVGKQMQAFKAAGAGQMQEARTLGQMESKMGAAGFEAEGAIKLALPVIDKVPRTDFLPFNKLIVGYQNQTLNPDQAELFTRIQAIKNAYQAVMQRGANVSTVYSGVRADELLNSAANPEVLKRVLGTMQTEINMARELPERMRNFYKARNGPSALEPSKNLSDQNITGVNTVNAPANAPVFKLPESVSPAGFANWARANRVPSGASVTLSDGSTVFAP